MAKKKKKGLVGNIVASNRKARHEYFIEETFEAGIILEGTEVKALAASTRPMPAKRAVNCACSTPSSPNTSRPVTSTTSRGVPASC